MNTLTEDEKVEPMTFEKLKADTAADLKEVARLIGETAAKVETGDMAAMDDLLDDGYRRLFEMLLIRYSYRQERRDGQ
jgi:hypothetical protein